MSKVFSFSRSAWLSPSPLLPTPGVSSQLEKILHRHKLREIRRNDFSGKGRIEEHVDRGRNLREREHIEAVERNGGYTLLVLDWLEHLRTLPALRICENLSREVVIAKNLVDP